MSTHAGAGEKRFFPNQSTAVQSQNAKLTEGAKPLLDLPRPLISSLPVNRMGGTGWKVQIVAAAPPGMDS